MIGLDTNILVRYLTQDDPDQSAKATELIEHRLTERDPGFISVVAMVETAWVLDRAYGLEAQERQGLGSFADALIAELGSRAGCRHTLTFDQKANASMKPRAFSKRRISKYASANQKI